MEETTTIAGPPAGAAGCIPPRPCAGARRLRRPAATAIACGVLAVAFEGHALTLGDPAHFASPRTFTVAPGVPRPLGGIRFSSDGTTLYAVGTADESASALYAMAVTRDGTGVVDALGAPVKVFDGQNPSPDPAGLDAGLQFGPAGTLFYSYFPSSYLGERPGGIGGTQSVVSVPGVSSLSGIAFSPHRPDAGTGFGTLQISTGVTGFVYELVLQESGPGTGIWMVPPRGFPTLFAKLFAAGPPRVGGQSVTGLEYVPGGTYGGDLLYTSYVDGELWRVAIDPASGLPVGGSSTPTQALFASGFGAPPFGLAFDPQSPDTLLVSTWDDASNAGNTIVEITGFAAVFGSTSTSSTTVTVPGATTTTSSSTHAPTTSTSTSTVATTSSTSSTSTTAAPTSSTSSTTTTWSAPASSTTSTTSPSPSSTTTSPPTTTSSAPASTSIVPTTSSTSTSTTTLRAVCDASDPSSCDDGDPCTRDRCASGLVCEHDEESGFAALACACERPLPAVCAGRTLPSGVVRRRDRACALFAAGAERAGKRGRRALLRGGSALKRAVRQGQRAARAGKLPGDCASALALQLGADRERALALAESL